MATEEEKELMARIGQLAGPSYGKRATAECRILTLCV